MILLELLKLNSNPGSNSYVTKYTMTCKFHNLAYTETYILLIIRIMHISELEIKIYLNVFGIMQIYNNMQIVNDKNVHQHMSGIKYFIF